MALGAFAQGAMADPVNAPNGNVVTAVCGSTTIQLAVNGNGEWTPGHVVVGTAVFVPTAFDLTFSFTSTGGTTESETDTSVKPGKHAGTVTCALPAGPNTFVVAEGTFTLSGTVTGFFTPRG